MSDAQLAGGEASCASVTDDVWDIVMVVHAGSPFTACAKAVTSSLMQVEYWATVAVQSVGRVLHPELLAQGSAAC